jgi:serine/threonine protein kinase
MKCPQCQAENLPDSRFCHKCATPLPKEGQNIIPFTETFQAYVKELTRGTVFAGRYEVIEELGKGGMGRVYRVFDKKLQEVVALKLLNPEISFNEKAVDRFRNELRFARKISHRNVVRLFDLGEEGFTLFITMEYVDGENLKRFIKRSGQLTSGKAVGIALQVCEGLAEAHHLGVIHRDLKPQNIMIDRDGNARVLDFGIARFMDAEDITASGVMIGTPEYMSPEQIDLKEVDGRTDIYSLGIILYEMLTGRVPFEGETPLSVALKHKSQIPKNPRELNPHIDAGLAGIILKCLEKDRDRRCQNAGDLRNDLDRFLQGLPTTETSFMKKQPTASREITVTFRLKKLLMPGLVVLSVAALALVGRFTVFKPKAAQPFSQEARQGMVMPPGSPTGKPPVRIVEKEAGGTGPQGILSFLGSEAEKYLNAEDLKSIKDPQSFMERLKKALPQDNPALMDIWSKANNKVLEGKRFQDQGRPDLARKSHREGQMQMKELLTLVENRQSVQTARDEMARIRDQVQKSGQAEKNVLFLIARNQESSAEGAFLKNDFSGARTLYLVLGKIYRLALGCANNQTCIQALQAYAAEQKREVDVMNPAQVDRWTYDFAGEIVNQAQSFLSQKQPENAVASYLQAAFLYEKIKDRVPS